ncbi:MAG: polyphosphate kinase 1 [Phycisphaeraceae bacterium]|nr:polyphosphate kinase 1 [Phycisphaeraceae bacterium]
MDKQGTVAASDGLTRAKSPRFLNRELSWLEFNRRVLHEALDERTPLLERVFFLSIFNSNLDEFFQKRVGGLRRQIAANVSTRTPDGLSPAETLAAIRAAVLEMLNTQADCFVTHIKPALREKGVHLLTWGELTDAERAWARDFYRVNLFPVLTPLAVDPGHPFPFISNLSTSLGVILRVPRGSEGGGALPGTRDDAPLADAPGSSRQSLPGSLPGAGALPGAEGQDDNLFGGERQFARVKVPGVLPRWVRIGGPGAGQPLRFVHVEQILRHNFQDLFEGMEIEDVMPFRITRNADVERDEEDAEDLLELIEQELRDRRFAPVVRLEVGPEPNEAMVRFLMNELELNPSDVYRMPGELDYTDLSVIHQLNLGELKHPPFTPVCPPRLADEEADIFSVIRAGDVLVHHPYESFKTSVERFIRTAADDPKVIAIKQTLYRTNPNSPFIPDLMRAAESGKQVICLVELKARFDEERNIQMAQQLEKAGVHVVYGMVGLKTHTKTAMVVRQEAEGVRVYAHIGTGNYNSQTAQMYTDLGLFTCNPAYTNDVVELFHYLTGRSIKRDFKTLLVAPTNMRRRFTEMIDREIALAETWKQRGSRADDPERPRIIAKMNSLEDVKMCEKLYEASAAGVRIDLIVRGFCCLTPSVAGLSQNIRVTSTIGRFLEHSRIYYFHNAGKGEYYIGSADWMYRNLNNRVECIAPVLDSSLHPKLRQILDVMLADRRQTWDMLPDGCYAQRQPDGADATAACGTHQALMDVARRDAAPHGEAEGK